MTTTTLTVSASTYNFGRQHAHFDVRSSTPTAGAMNDRDAQGYWWVYRDGEKIKSEFGTLDFGWLGLDGDVVYAAAVDSSGNIGDTQSYTFSVSSNESADAVYYVNGSTGSNTNDGSSGSPWATLTYAVTQIKSELTEGQVGVIFIAGGQTYTESTQQGDNETGKLIRVVWDETGGSRPHIDFPEDSNGFNSGLSMSWHLEGLELDGNDVDQQVGTGFNFSRVGGTLGVRNAHNCMVVNCHFVQWGNNVEGDDDTVTPADRDSGIMDFVAFEDVSMDPNNVSRYGFYGFRYVDKWLFRNISMTGTAQFNFTSTRLWSLGRGYAEDFYVNTTSNTSRLRLLPGPTEDVSGAMRYNTWNRLTFLDGYEVALETDSGVSGLSYVHDVRFINLKSEGGISLRATEGLSANMVVPTRVDFINCTLNSQVSIDGDTDSGGVMESLRFRDCGVSRSSPNQGFFLIQGSESSYASNFLDTEGCYVYWGMTDDFAGGGVFYNAPNISTANLAAKVRNSDYNHTGKVDGDTLNWTYTSDGFGSLASWQSSYSLDSSSTTTNNTTFELTDDGYPDASSIDLTLSADGGPLAGAGYPLAAGVAIDASGFLRSSTSPDAGPYEFGATETPEDPVIGGGGQTTYIKLIGYSRIRLR